MHERWFYIWHLHVCVTAFIKPPRPSAGFSAARRGSRSPGILLRTSSSLCTSMEQATRLRCAGDAREQPQALREAGSARTSEQAGEQTPTQPPQQPGAAICIAAELAPASALQQPLCLHNTATQGTEPRGCIKTNTPCANTDLHSPALPSPPPSRRDLV